MQVVTQGLIIKEQAVGESDRLVTILTKDEGVVRAFARRAKNLKDSKNAATGLLCYSRLKLSKGRDTYNVNEAFPIEVFFGLRKDVTALALAQYFCQLAVELVPEGVESSEYLRLVLNALHFLCQGTRPQPLLKAIVELRMVSEAGYMPNLAYCANCGAYQAERMYFKINRGSCTASPATSTPATPARPCLRRPSPLCGTLSFRTLRRYSPFRFPPAPWGSSPPRRRLTPWRFYKNAQKPWISTTACCKGKSLSDCHVKNGEFPGNMREKKVK